MLLCAHTVVTTLESKGKCSALLATHVKSLTVCGLGALSLLHSCPAKVSQLTGSHCLPTDQDIIRAAIDMWMDWSNGFGTASTQGLYAIIGFGAGWVSLGYICALCTQQKLTRLGHALVSDELSVRCKTGRPRHAWICLAGAVCWTQARKLGRTVPLNSRPDTQERASCCL